MIYVVKIKNGLVHQAIVAPGDHQPTEKQVVVGPENVVGIGWS